MGARPLGGISTHELINKGTAGLGIGEKMAAPVRIVFCITELDAGGAERALTQLVTNLDRSQWDSHVICLGPRGHFTDVLEAAGIPVICLNAGGLLSLPRVLFQLTRWLSRLRPELLQTFLFHANILGRVAAYWARVPIVVCGLRVAEYRSRWYGRIDRWTNSIVTTNVCVSQGVADFSAQRSKLPVNKIVVIPNSVDISRFANSTPADLTELGIPANSRVLISIGRLEHQKGIDILLDAIAAMTVDSPKRVDAISRVPADTHFLIVGDGPDAHRLREQADRNRISHCVHFAGRREDVPALLAASVALILPSRWEGMPNVVLEAMAAARPVIATRVEGIAELIQDEVTGLIVPVEQPEALAKAINTLLSDPQFLASAGRRSQDVVVNGFAVPTVVQMYSELYRRLLNSR